MAFDEVVEDVSRIIDDAIPLDLRAAPKPLAVKTKQPQPTTNGICIVGDDVDNDNFVLASGRFVATYLVGLGFAVASFVPGLFWGWMYTKHHSLFGVSVSHILVGVWATFVVGIEHLF